jgi:hypothetical protein
MGRLMALLIRSYSIAGSYGYWMDILGTFLCC